MRITKAVLSAMAISMMGLQAQAQYIDRERPAEWDALVDGARFIDRFQPMQGKVLSDTVWGADCVLPRYIDNGIEDGIWSYWGGNIYKEGDKYHMFVAAWLENNPKGHHEWSKSYVIHAVSDNLSGPFKPVKVIGKGHNPEMYKTDSGKYVLYVIKGRYLADSIDGPWEAGNFEFDLNGHEMIEDLSNITFARRPDGSILAVCRGGGIWVSDDGVDKYTRISDGSVYPKVDGRFEDPVVWRDSVQYNLIVNDWYGRIAYYLRSADGLNWVVDPGEAYTPGIAVHDDGVKEDWFKYERLKIYQDEYGRAIQANFAVIDTLKDEDKGNDKHSSKNICIPLNPGVRMQMLDNPTVKSKEYSIVIYAEPGFNPAKDVDVASLRFGASDQVNYGNGAAALGSEVTPEGNLIVKFKAKPTGISAQEFAPKLIGRYTDGSLLYGYAKNPFYTAAAK